MEVGGQRHAPDALPPGKNRHPLCRRLSWPQDRSTGAKNLASTGIRSPDRPSRSEYLYRTLHFLNRASWHTYVRKTNKMYTFLNNFFLQSATNCIRFWLAQLIYSNCFYSVLLFSDCLRSCSLYLPKRHLPKSVLGLPVGLLDMGFHLLIFCILLSSAMRSTWPNQFSLCFFNKPNYILSF